ncbi:MAG: hypothetical protein HC919_02830 [Oscillatoriales cyanobacterium SM2_2_1]|nr:hypothetical protein [Oscillatoriales cyanobacterium SM2_2_1]
MFPFLWTSPVIQLTIPPVEQQTEYWSCGPNAAARLLRFYGHPVTYSQLKAAVVPLFAVPPRLRNPLTNEWAAVRTGVPPRQLQQLLSRWEGDRIRLSHRNDFSQLQALLNRRTPAIALIRVGTLRLSTTYQSPLLHWVVVSGIDPQNQQITYVDTDGQSRTTAIAAFQQQWHFQVEHPLLRTVLTTQQVIPGTLIWRDRP